MPIRSPRGRAAAYRGIWQWPLRSPARLVTSVVVALALAFGVSTGIGALGGGGPGGIGLVPLPVPGSTTGASGPTSARAAPAPAPLKPVPDLTTDSLPLSQAPPEALDVASRWVAAWLRPPSGTTTQQWIDGLRALTVDDFLATLDSVDPANIPATRIIGGPRAVRVSPGSVEVEVPTDALTLIVLVTDTGTGWRVSGFDRA